jgi:hypothetical protein
MKISTRWTRGGATCLALAVLAAGCAHQQQGKLYDQIRPDMANNNWPGARAKLEGGKEQYYREQDAVMYWLDLGTLIHYANGYEESQANFVKAEERMDDLWTKSVTDTAQNYLVREGDGPYAGEDHEHVLVYLYTALNDVKLGKFQDAVVEARRADGFLQKLQIQYGKDKQEGSGTLYGQDAFMLWLVGLLYEMEGPTSVNDAFIAYKAAYVAYKSNYAKNFDQPIPSYLGEDLVRTARQLGFKDEVARFTKETGATGATRENIAQGMGEVVLLDSHGEAPFKQQFLVEGVLPNGVRQQVALPRFVAVPHQVAYAEFGEAGAVAKTELAEPIDRIVLKNFEFQLPAVKRRAIVRFVAKVALREKMCAESFLKCKLAGVLSNASEQTDLRTWKSLPADVGVGRLWLPAGTHKIHVTFRTASGVETARAEDIDVTDLKAGEHRIVSVRSLQ